MNKKLSIVIVCFNKWNFTQSCLKDLSSLPNDHEIIVIDNASTDQTKQQMMELERSLEMKETLRFIRNEENVFHSKACNQGFGKATGENICFLNNDIRVMANHATWTKNLIGACNSTDGLIGPTMGQLDQHLNFVKEANQQLSGHSYLSGWCVAGKREAWEKFKINDEQVWDERLPFYFNDTDLSFRARQKNIPLTFVPLPDVVHFGKVSAQQVNVSKLYNEGRQVFLKKWGNK